MKNTNFLLFSVCLLISSLFFTNCSAYYGPASTGNSAHYISRPWYDEEPAQSVQVSARLNKAPAYNLSETNRFGEAEINYARVFENGHIALGGGATFGNYKVVLPNRAIYNGNKAYNGTILRGEVGVHLLPFLSNVFGGRVRNSNAESTSGIGYCWTTEKGVYAKFRRFEYDSLSNVSAPSTISQNLHTFSFFNERRYKLANEDIVGGRMTMGMTLETGLLDAMSDFQYNGTLFYTHKRFTFYGQVGGSLVFNGDNKINPNLSLGMNASLYEWKKY
jgi:hypothetical protein